VAWHNRVHHGNTNIAGRDPDAYPSLQEYESSSAARYAVLIGAPRSGKWRGIITLLLGFTIQSTQVLLFARRRGHLSTADHRLALVHTLGLWAMWGAVVFWLGPVLSAMLLFIPLMVGNSIVMAHIITNHSLSPLHEQNDALETSLSVTVPRWFNFYTLGFGYHVEHHMFPGMSHKRGPEVSEMLRDLAPNRYQSMPLLRALRLLFTTPRVYMDRTTLGDPQTSQRWVTVGPHRTAGALSLGGAEVLGREAGVVIAHPALALIREQGSLTAPIQRLGTEALTASRSTTVSPGQRPSSIPPPPVLV
jgi:fatty acid desaturase